MKRNQLSLDKKYNITIIIISNQPGVLRTWISGSLWLSCWYGVGSFEYSMCICVCMGLCCRCGSLLCSSWHTCSSSAPALQLWPHLNFSLDCSVCSMLDTLLADLFKEWPNYMSSVSCPPANTHTHLRTVC